MMNRLFACTILLVLSFPAIAADANGYTAQYECRAGNPNCDVDVVGLTSRNCDQTISASTPWSAINWSNSTICIEAGDHTSKGVLTIPQSASGSANNYKVLRYYRSGDTNDEPWNQSDGNRAKIHQLNINGPKYWVVHRITLPPTASDNFSRIVVSSDSSFVILNRILVEGNGNNDTCYSGLEITSANASHLTLQNSVFRNAHRCTYGSPVAVSITNGSVHRVVNNEIYNWCEHQIQLGYNSIPQIVDLVVENNDLYLNSAQYDASGNAAAGWLLSMKASGSPSQPVRVVHNRLWGTRAQNGSLCGTPDSGHAIGFNAATSAANQYSLIQNNIVTDSLGGVAAYNNTISRHSIIGNLFYDIGPKGSQSYAVPLSFYSMSASQVYLNTLVNAVGAGSNNGSFGEWSGQSNLDIRCNVLLDSGAASTSYPGTSSQADYNAFYGTTPFTFNGTGSIISKTLYTRANSRPYSVGDVIRLSAAPNTSCTAANDSNCFLYQVITAGTSAQSPPSYCTSLGCTTTDGSMTVKAVRGPYSYYRKLRTAPELVTVPYARAHKSVAEANACPPDYASRPGIGVN